MGLGSTCNDRSSVQRMVSTLLLPTIAGAFIVTFYIDLLPAFMGGYADQRFLLAGLIAVFATIAAFFFTEWGSRGSSLSMAGWWLFVFSVTVSSLLHPTHSWGLLEAVMFPAYLIAVMGLVGLWRFSGDKEAGIRAMLTILAIAVMGYAMLTPALYGFALMDGVSRLDRYIPWGFVNIRYWSHSATWCLPLLPLVLLAGPLKEYRLWRAGVAFAGAIWWWMLFMSSSRGSLIGLFLGTVTVLLVFGRHCFPWLKVFSTHIGLGVLVWLLLSWLIPALFIDSPQMRSLGTDSSGRMPLWEEAWVMSLQYFPLGMGPQSWLTHEVLTDRYSASKTFGHPHNMYLLWAAEYGWLAVGGLALIGVAGFKRLWRHRALARVGGTSPERTLLLVGLSASVVAALVHASVSAIFMAPASMIIGLFVMGAFWSLVSVPSQRPEGLASRARKNWRRPVSAAIVFLGLTFWIYGVAGYYQAMQVDLGQNSGLKGTGFLPRFWHHGNFPRHPDQMPPPDWTPPE